MPCGVAATAALAASGALAGCGASGSGAPAGSDTTAAPGSKVAAIQARGVLNAGVKKDVPGYGYYDPAARGYEGMEIDLCYQVAASIFGVSYEEAREHELVVFTDVTPKTRGPFIDNDQLDVVCATYTITPALFGQSREAFYKRYSAGKWKMGDGKDIVVNRAKLGCQGCVDVIAAAYRSKLGELNAAKGGAQ